MFSDVALTPKTSFVRRHVDPPGQVRTVDIASCIKIEPPFTNVDYLYNIGLLVDDEMTVHTLTNIAKNADLEISIDVPSYVTITPAMNFSLSPDQSVVVTVRFSPENAETQVFSGIREWTDTIKVSVRVILHKNEPVYT